MLLTMAVPKLLELLDSPALLEATIVEAIQVGSRYGLEGGGGARYSLRGPPDLTAQHHNILKGWGLHHNTTTSQHHNITTSQSLKGCRGSNRRWGR